MMAKTWLTAYSVEWGGYPNHVDWALCMNLDREPLECHAILCAIEQYLMDGRVSKRHELVIAHRAQDALSTHIQDYD